ncbi:M28 family peptidase [candidate division KSB1 bacterium]|nr:M28 family peptidase [candidate division KSB1 bacterium]NIR69305.1 M28 family peptidase [candidate division KSB1 bacterium]NIS22711.1 M28 family peptidase [candidate division KSB1 bacterium]NIT69557.1 M28 family peptidase [candidate division KSB1 bacterium]NIU23211.1 M28 family peptidase [candidate division KSB1 bacterium]
MILPKYDMFLKTQLESSSRKLRYLTILVVMASLVHTACGNDKSEPPVFDGARAYDYLVKQCDFGPRVPGTQAHRACLNYLTSELQKFDANVSHQSFLSQIPKTGQSVTMTNIVASFGVNKTERILLCAHWDTRPWADEDDSTENNDKPILGANDGASGVAVLMEVARHLQLREPKVGVDIILFDGEDAGIPGQSHTYALGSRHFAKNKNPGYRPKFGLLLDMVGDKDLDIYQEEHSLEHAPYIVDKVWTKAQGLNLTKFIPMPGYEVTDDHLPLLEAGIPCIDIIDFNYRYWHTLEDTPDKCSPESLATVGQLVLSVIYED